MEASSLKQYLADAPPTVVQLEIEQHFNDLNEKQKLYAHHLSRAAHLGTRIVFRQLSPESEPIYDMIIGLHESCNGDWKQLEKETGVSEQDVKSFLEYSAQFLGNNGNYKGFGDSKIVPRISRSALESIVAKSPKARHFYEVAEASGGIYANEDQLERMHLGWPEKGHLSNYYPRSPTITEAEIVTINKSMAEKGLLPENTRIRKLHDHNFEVLVASGVKNPPADSIDVGEKTSWELDGHMKGKTVSIVFGDYREQMAKIALEMKQASLVADKDEEKQMIEQYTKAFSTGSSKAFKDSQRTWVKIIGPAVETNIGFIETYRDPSGVRAEWEGLVATVNKERTKAFSALVEGAPSMIPKLPWGKDFEKDKFVAPDFTSLEVLTFTGSGIPAGINIPNFEDIRREVGFKNVSLGNVLNAKTPDEKVPFIRDEDQEVYQKHRDHAFEVQVGIHELLGHGTGKLLQETSPGEYNFDPKDPPISPVTNKPVSTYYKPSETWSSVFGFVSSSYEECRAECVAMALSCDFGILKIFDAGNGEEDINGPGGDVLYASYLLMARAGVVALEQWDPKSKKWGQAHMQARYAIMRVFLDAGDGFLKFDYKEDDASDLTIHLDRNKILSHGRPAVENFLQKLHVYKCTADLAAGKKLYQDATEVGEWYAEKLRSVVLSKRLPRKIFVQANTFKKDGKAELKEYEPTCEGMIQSFAERNI
ncbi:MAG: hypothetical protein MMC33_010047 [Icmadophila ericetorum]|nr:hypothetical protein [Icmadophila ericetorum]